MSEADEGLDEWTQPPVIRIVSPNESILARPRMYTLSGSFGEVAAYLDGYYWGLRRGGLEQEVTEWEEFRRWLTQRLCGKPGNSWLATFQQAYPDEAMAVNQLRVLFLEFRQRKNAEQVAAADRPRD